MAQQKGNNLESLMMAYADLSGGARGSSFKGPPLKEVKVAKQAAPAFTPSSKARDWTSLSQALEDAFVMGPSPTQKVDISSNPGLSAFSQWEGDPTPAQQEFQPPTQRQISSDDWGDFQDFQSPTETTKPIVQPTQEKSIMEDDDFADFVTASCPQLPFQPPHAPFQTVNPSFQHNPILINPSFPTHSPNPIKPPHPAPIISNSVGLRLASFQEESPVHNFRGGPKFEAPRLSDSPTRFEAFFGGDDESFHFEINSTSLPGNINFKISLNYKFSIYFFKQNNLNLWLKCLLRHSLITTVKM